ncbi:MAG: VOC family protein [Burkholderiales bacterium]|nr:VOC family protein [Burkholderiales bacterium]
MFSKIHHVAIICSNYEKSKYFYNKVLGLPIIREIHRASRDSFKLDLQLADGGQIELFSFPNAPQRVSYPEACGLRHLSFCVDNIVKTVKYLENNNVKCEEIRIDEYTQKTFTFFSDPDGLPLELYEK